ncbi:MAG: DUF3024 domain-containing protein [Caulobacteraceae bacterium]
MRSFHSRRLETPLPAGDQADGVELCDRHIRRVGGCALPLHPALQGREHSRGEEFDAPFARIDRMGPNRFDIYWMRHTGKWWRLHTGATLTEALDRLETDEILHPI